MNITEYAKSELERLGKDDEGMQELINKDILEIVERFASQGHSGFFGQLCFISTGTVIEL